MLKFKNKKTPECTAQYIRSFPKFIVRQLLVAFWLNDYTNECINTRCYNINTNVICC